MFSSNVFVEFVEYALGPYGSSFLKLCTSAKTMGLNVDLT